MRKRSKNVMAVLLAAAMMSGSGSLSVTAADFTEEEILELEAEEELLAEDGEDDTEVSFEEEIPLEEETAETYAAEETTGNIAAYTEEFSDSEAVGDDVADNYGIRIAGVWISSENKSDVLGDGTVSYDEINHILTLNNAHIAGVTDDSQGIFYSNLSEVLKVELKGQNTVETAETTYKENFTPYFIVTQGKLVITGDENASLTFRSKNNERFIKCNGTLIIEKVSLDFNAEKLSEFSSGIQAENNMEIREKANVKTGSSMIRQNGSQNPYGSIEISDSTLTGGRIEGTKITVKNNSTVNINTTQNSGLWSEKGLDITDSEVSITAPEGYAVNVGDGTENVPFNITNSKIKAASDRIWGVVHINNCNMQVKNSIVEINGTDSNSIRSDNRCSFSVEDSWVDCAGKIDTSQKTVSNSVVFDSKNGIAAGKVTVPEGVEVGKDRKLTVSGPTVLTVSSGQTLDNKGSIQAHCKGINGNITGNPVNYVHEKLSQIVNDKNYHWKECLDCGAVVEKTAHTYGAWRIFKNASEVVTGEQEHYCTVCNYAESGTIPALPVTGKQIVELKIKGGKKSMSLSWKKIAGADGYMIYGTKCGKKYQLKKDVGSNITKWKENKLAAGTYYKYYVVAYKLENGQKTVIGRSSDMHTATTGKGYGYAKKIKLNRTSLTLKKGKKAKIKATLISTNKKYNSKTKEHLPRIRFASTNTKVATVNKSGTVTARGTGTCYIHCYGLNGLNKKVKITVK